MKLCVVLIALVGCALSAPAVKRKFGLGDLTDAAGQLTDMAGSGIDGLTDAAGDFASHPKKRWGFHMPSPVKDALGNLGASFPTCVGGATATCIKNAPTLIQDRHDKNKLKQDLLNLGVTVTADCINDIAQVLGTMAMARGRRSAPVEDAITDDEGCASSGEVEIDDRSATEEESEDEDCSGSGDEGAEKRSEESEDEVSSSGDMDDRSAPSMPDMDDLEGSAMAMHPKKRWGFKVPSQLSGALGNLGASVLPPCVGSASATCVKALPNLIRDRHDKRALKYDLINVGVTVSADCINDIAQALIAAKG